MWSNSSSSDFAGAARGASFEMLQNEPFGAVARGIAGAIPIEMAGKQSRAQLAMARAAALRQNHIDPLARARAEQVMRRLHALGSGTPLSRIRIVAPTRNGVLSLAATRSHQQKGSTRGTAVVKGSPLRFVFQGFEAEQRTNLESFVQRAYPLMVALYGEPAPVQQGRAVTVVSDLNAGDGIYELPPAGATSSGGTIRIAADLPIINPPYDPNKYNLTRQMLIAFHGALIFGFDAWELGFTDAAALIVNYQILGSPRNFDPSQLGVYLLPVYDMFNRPELGNAFFFATGTSANLGFFRAGMAQAAWLKVYVENPSFFRQFNATYYAQVATQNISNNGVPLPGNTPALKRIAASFAPTVEGLTFTDWYRRQYVLDTSITTGEKLWFAILPEANLVTGDTRSVFFGVAQHYRTLANGDETPISGIGNVTALDERGVDVTRKSAELALDNRVIFNPFGEAELNSQRTQVGQLPIVGFTNTGTPDQGRITLQLRVATAEAVAYFPYNAAGTETSPAAFYGATLGTNAGRVTIQSTSGATATLARGVFKTTSSVIYPSNPRVKTTFTLTPSDGAGPLVMRRNSAWSMSGGNAQSLAVLLETAPGNTAFALNLRRTPDNRLRMFSLPLIPTQSDEAAVLGVDARMLLLARYRPNISPVTFSKNGITYGVTADKHELYPNISEPFTPGRAYWLNLRADLAATVRGGEPPRTQPYEVPLLGGWNQVGVPFNLPFDLNAVRVRFLNGAPVSFASAVNSGLVAPGVWRWKPEGGYTRVDTGDAANQRLQPFEGYYIFARQPRGTKLIFDARTARASVGIVTITQWQLPLIASTDSARDENNAIGVLAAAGGQAQRIPAAKPPAAARALTLTFNSSGTAMGDASGAGADTGWAESFVAPFTASASWSFLIDGASEGETVRLEWGDTKSLPSSLDLTLIDESTGQTIAMVNTEGVRSYAFTAGSTARKFRIEGKVLPLAIQDLSVANLTGSRSVTVLGKFGLKGTVQVAVRTPDGGQVRTLTETQAVSVGTTCWMWNGRSDEGQLLPLGRYLAHIEFMDGRGVITGKTVPFSLK